MLTQHSALNSKKMNIGFKKLGQDDCQDSVVYHDHMVSLNFESEELIIPKVKRPIECSVVPREAEPEQLHRRNAESGGGGGGGG